MKMKVKTIAKIVGVCVGSYWIGKMVGASIGAKAVLNKYTDVIPEDAFEVKLVDNAVVSLTVTAKKRK